MLKNSDKILKLGSEYLTLVGLSVRLSHDPKYSNIRQCYIKLDHLANGLVLNISIQD